MEIRLAQTQDINAWMALVEQVRDAFPGLETTEAIAEHRATVLHIITQSSAICAIEADRIIGILLFFKETGELCFLAVDSTCRTHMNTEKTRWNNFSFSSCPPAAGLIPAAGLLCPAASLVICA